MSNNLIQKSALKSIEFTIDDTGLLFNKKSRNSEHELHFSFEQLKTNKASEVEHNKFLVVCASLATFFTICLFAASQSDKTIETSTTLFWAFVSVVLFSVYFLLRTKKTYLYTTDNKFIDFYSDKPSTEEVSRFIENLLNERNSFLVSRYGNPNRNLEYAPQLENLNWLLNTKAISKAKYDEKLMELNSLFGSHQNVNPIGFSPKAQADSGNY